MPLTKIPGALLASVTPRVPFVFGDFAYPDLQGRQIEADRRAGSSSRWPLRSTREPSGHINGWPLLVSGRIISGLMQVQKLKFFCEACTCTSQGSLLVLISDSLQFLIKREKHRERYAGSAWFVHLIYGNVKVE